MWFVFFIGIEIQRFLFWGVAVPMHGFHKGCTLLPSRVFDECCRREVNLLLDPFDIGNFIMTRVDNGIYEMITSQFCVVKLFSLISVFICVGEFFRTMVYTSWNTIKEIN